MAARVLAVVGVGAGVGIGIGAFSFFTVQRTEMANVRRFGTPRFAEPLTSGFYWKIPLIDKVDRIQVSLTTLHIPQFKVNTVDNQQISLDLNFNYTLPASHVNHLLYGVGRAGGGSLDASIIPVVKDRAGRVFNKQNTTTISSKREDIQSEVTREVFQAVVELFGLEPHSLQFAQIGYSQTFIESNEHAVKTKNSAIAEENKVAVERAKAEQCKIIAQGQADALLATARGEAEATIMKAESEKRRRELEGEGEAARLRSELASFHAFVGGTSSNYIEYLKAKALHGWNGKPPEVLVSGAHGSPLLVPFPFKAPAPQLGAKA